MNKLVFTILLSLCTMQGWAKAQCDTLGIDQSTIKEIVTESYVNTKGAKATKTYAVVYYNGAKHLCTISKTVLSKVTLCNRYGCRLALGLVRKNKVPARVVLLLHGTTVLSLVLSVITTRYARSYYPTVLSLRPSAYEPCTVV